eukprot:3259324-Pyramimonas_sp.AAC.1
MSIVYVCRSIKPRPCVTPRITLVTVVLLLVTLSISLGELVELVESSLTLLLVGAQVGLQV